MSSENTKKSLLDGLKNKIKDKEIREREESKRDIVVNTRFTEKRIDMSTIKTEEKDKDKLKKIEAMSIKDNAELKKKIEQDKIDNKRFFSPENTDTSNTIVETIDVANTVSEEPPYQKNVDRNILGSVEINNANNKIQAEEIVHKEDIKIEDNETHKKIRNITKSTYEKTSKSSLVEIETDLNISNKEEEISISFSEIKSIYGGKGRKIF